MAVLNLIVAFAVYENGSAFFNFEFVLNIVATYSRHNYFSVVLHIDNGLAFAEKGSVDYHVFKSVPRDVDVKIEGYSIVFAIAIKEYVLKDSVPYIRAI